MGTQTYRLSDGRTLKEAAMAAGVKYGTAHHRVTKQGMTPDEAVLKPHGQRLRAKPRRKNDLAGKRFGKLTAIEYSHSDSGGNAHWLCRCDCGRNSVVNRQMLIRGDVRSCGCIQHAYGHQMSGTRLFKIWSGIKTRTNPNNSAIEKYKDYAGRGIVMCDEWRGSFEAFAEWSKANGYCDGLSIDRIDVNGGYEPSNCRWATAVTQARNKRSNRYLPTGELVSEFAERMGTSQRSHRRLLEEMYKEGYAACAEDVARKKPMRYVHRPGAPASCGSNVISSLAVRIHEAAVAYPASERMRWTWRRCAEEYGMDITEKDGWLRFGASAAQLMPEGMTAEQVVRAHVTDAVRLKLLSNVMDAPVPSSYSNRGTPSAGLVHSYCASEMLSSPSEMIDDIIVRRLATCSEGVSSDAYWLLYRGQYFSGYSKLRQFQGHAIGNIRKFCADMGVSKVLDPCAGWGHRMLGAAASGVGYVGNDINSRQVLNLSRMASGCKIDAELTCGDAADEGLYGSSGADGVFTCPPYWNKEIYTADGAERLSWEDFREWLARVIELSRSVGPAGFQLPKSYAPWLPRPSEIVDVAGRSRGSASGNECVYVWR